ncbi:hypothetical protein SPHINGOR109_10459 [Sphingorhabdus sp. 109]|nr:hypothetical protein SPHINGOR109_10459 [Sphingorhabdus sp. 109]
MRFGSRLCPQVRPVTQAREAVFTARLSMASWSLSIESHRGHAGFSFAGGLRAAAAGGKEKRRGTATA